MTAFRSFVEKLRFFQFTCSFNASRLAPELSNGLIAFVLLEATAQCRAKMHKDATTLLNGFQDNVNSDIRTPIHVMY